MINWGEVVLNGLEIERQFFVVRKRKYPHEHPPTTNIVGIRRGQRNPEWPYGRHGYI